MADTLVVKCSVCEKFSGSVPGADEKEKQYDH
jgi:hypothetical protein